MLNMLLRNAFRPFNKQKSPSGMLRKDGTSLCVIIHLTNMAAAGQLK
jgi:hypothetical protein